MSDAKGWIVRTVEGEYLFPHEGDVGTTSDIAEAGIFESYGEACETARDHCDPGFKVLPR